MKKTVLARIIRPLAAVTLLLMAAPLFAQNSVYRWTDESGIVHYGATPPLGVEAELVKAGTSNSPGEDESSTATPGAEGEAAQGEAAAPEVKLSPEMQARKDTMCKEERERLASLQKPGRIRMKAPDGSIKYLSMEEVQAEINTTKKVIEDTCN